MALAQDAGAARVPRVFVSYSHDDERHRRLVREFATFLRVDVGVDVRLDQWADDRRRDWSLWAIEQLAEADFVLVIASPGYQRRAEGTAAPDQGRGAQFEAAMIRDNLTRDLPRATRRFLPVVLPGRSVEEIPAFLDAHSTTRYESPWTAWPACWPCSPAYPASRSRGSVTSPAACARPAPVPCRSRRH